MPKPPAPISIVAKVRELMKAPHIRGTMARSKDSPTAPSVPLDEFVALLFECGGSAYQVAKRLNIPHTIVAQRRKWLEEKLNIELPRGRVETWKAQPHRQAVEIELLNGTIIVGSDAHVWPEIYGTAMAAFVDFHRRLKPDHCILNGDGFDGAKISRHSRIGWDKRPGVDEELEALSDFLDQVHKASPNTKKKRTKGNHDDRFDTYFSSHAPDSENVRGTKLSDHLPGWQECMSVEINGNCVIKHRHRGGIHVTWTNVRDYGCHIITGHTHRQVCRPWTNKMGTWYGVDAGMLAPVDGPQFDYVEKSPTDWRSGFVVLTFRDGQLMPPDLATVTNEDAGELYFRGETFKYEL